MTAILDETTTDRLRLVQAVLRTCGRAVACADFRAVLPAFELSMIDTELRDLQAHVERLGTDLSVANWKAYVARTPPVDMADDVSRYDRLLRDARPTPYEQRMLHEQSSAYAHVRRLTLTQLTDLHRAHKTWPGVARHLQAPLHTIENQLYRLRRQG